MKRFILTLTSCFLFSLGFGQSNINPCPGVTADFESEPDLPAGGIHFSNTSTNIDNNTYSYLWEFGNGEVSADKHPFMMYEEGVYAVKLTISGSGCASIAEKEVTFSYGGH